MATDAVARVVLCRVFKIARTSLCGWLAIPTKSKELASPKLANALLCFHPVDPELRHHFIRNEAAEAGGVTDERTTLRLCLEVN